MKIKVCLLSAMLIGSFSYAAETYLGTDTADKPDATHEIKREEAPSFSLHYVCRECKPFEAKINAIAPSIRLKAMLLSEREGYMWRTCCGIRIDLINEDGSLNFRKIEALRKKPLPKTIEETPYVKNRRKFKSQCGFGDTWRSLEAHMAGLERESKNYLKFVNATEKNSPEAEKLAYEIEQRIEYNIYFNIDYES
jgi:hypothetical protein